MNTTYMVIENQDLDHVTVAVNAFLELGWKLQGGIAMVSKKDPYDNYYSIIYAQAMSKQQPLF